MAALDFKDPNSRCSAGLNESDHDVYKTFTEAFEQIIKDYSKLPSDESIVHPNVSHGDLDKIEFEDLDNEGHYVVSTSIRVGRAHDGFTIPPISSMKSIESSEGNMKFTRDIRLDNNISLNQTNLGHSKQSSVKLRIPLLSGTDVLRETCKKFRLRSREVFEEGTELEDRTYDISNMSLVGLTELEAIMDLYTGTKELIRLEKQMEWQPENVDEMFEVLSKSKTHNSILKRHLTKDVFDKLKYKKTSKNGTLGDCVISGVKNIDSAGIGIFAPDPEAYTKFAILFDPLIKDYHRLSASDDISHPAVDFGDLENLDFGDIDPTGEMISSTRIRVGRSHHGFPFPPVLSKEERIIMEEKTVRALEALEGELKGVYHPLVGMTRKEQHQMTKDHFLFQDNDRYMRAAGVYRDWPEGRGIFFSHDKKFLVWVNEEDHLRLISMQKDGNLGTVYKRLVAAIKAMEKHLTFARDDRLGYLTFCPTNLGTTLRASVHIKIPRLSVRDDFNEILDKNKLQARGINGVRSESEGGVFDLSNKRRLGLSEIDIVSEMAAGIREIMYLEKQAEAEDVS